MSRDFLKSHDSEVTTLSQREGGTERGRDRERERERERYTHSQRERERQGHTPYLQRAGKEMSMES